MPEDYSSYQNFRPMKISLFNTSYSRQVVDLFSSVFSASEGQSEGEVIGHLVSDLISSADGAEVLGFVAFQREEIVGCIFFSRFTVPADTAAFLLSPVAIATEQQGMGLGQKLIRYGLEYLVSENVELVFTYGDPSFYSKVGFEQIDETIVQAPFILSQPEGWLAQSLTGGVIAAQQGPSKCVEALSKQEYW